MQAIAVDLGDRSYPVYIGHGVLPQLGGLLRGLGSGGLVAVITVPPVRAHYGGRVEEILLDSGLGAKIIEVPDGERAKSLEVYSDVVEKLLDSCAGRDSVVVSLGGGCVGDLAGFVAATYMRGVRLVHVPTTLLAQVDASVGGKTAINHPRAKNLLGAFHQPSFVLADMDLLRTLPPREVGCGMAELIKYGAMLDQGLFGLLEEEGPAFLRLEAAPLEEAVTAAVRLKAGVVSRDELDQGSRMLLNFGHTVGHSIEAATSHGYSHGEAVALGMVAEAKISVGVGLLSEAEEKRLERLITAYGLPVRASGVPLGAVMALMGNDKKAKAGALRFALPRSLGEGTLISAPPNNLVLSSVREVVGD